MMNLSVLLLLFLVLLESSGAVVVAAAGAEETETQAKVAVENRLRLQLRVPTATTTAATVSHASTTTTTTTQATTTTANNVTIPTQTIGRDVHGLPVNMPLVGAGTWQYNDTVAYDSLCKAFQAGITFVDTAFGYHNQKGVSRAIYDCFLKTTTTTTADEQKQQLSKRRQDLFVLTKIPGGLNREQVHAAHHHNLFELNLEYVDHLMTHFPSDWGIKTVGKEQRQEEWLALEEIYYSGKARSIGVSHYCPRHIDDILEVATIMPSLNQVEYHVGSGDVNSVIEKCRQHNITFMSFSPLCGPCQIDNPEQDSLITGELVTSISKKYNVSGSQVALRFIVQQALANSSYIAGVIPKSNNLDHIKMNMDLFSFNLTHDDMDRLQKANQPAAEKGDCDVP